MEQECSNLT